MITQLFFISTLIAFCQATDYCRKDLCPQNKKGHVVNHIGCKNNGDFGPKCPKDRSAEPMTQERIALLLKTHNELRSEVANGRLNRYEPANKMIEMEWDHELAALAEMNAKTCIFAHDQCRSTGYIFKFDIFLIIHDDLNFYYNRTVDMFFLVGQNIHHTWLKNQGYDDVDVRLVESTKSWYREHELCDMSYINSYRVPEKNIGHFVQIVKDSADRVGCALTKYDDGQLKHMLVVCNYSVGDILDEPVYTTGKPCSKCLSGCSKKYSGLCNSNEKTYAGKKA